MTGSTMPWLRSAVTSCPPILPLRSPPPTLTPSSPSRRAKPSTKPKPSSRGPQRICGSPASSAGSLSSIPPSAISSTAWRPIPSSKVSAMSCRPSPTHTWIAPTSTLASSQLLARNLTYDILIVHHQLPAAIRLVDRHPDQLFVLDHIAKPAIRAANSSRGRGTSPSSHAAPMSCANSPASSPKPTTQPGPTKQILPVHGSRARSLYARAPHVRLRLARLLCRHHLRPLGSHRRALRRRAFSLRTARALPRHGSPRLSPRPRIATSHPLPAHRLTSSHQISSTVTISPAPLAPRSPAPPEIHSPSPPLPDPPIPATRLRRTRAPRTSTFHRAGKNRVNPALHLNFFLQLSHPESRPGTSLSPPSARSRGPANNAKVTIVDIGFPGNPKKYVPGSFPKTTGFPGWIRAPVKKKSAPRATSACSTKSNFPIETPPVSSTRSQPAASRIARSVAALVVPHNRQDHRLASGGSHLFRQ